MSARVKRDAVLIGGVVLAIVLWSLACAALAALATGFEAHDFVLLALFLPASALVSLLLGVLVAAGYRGRRLGSLRGKLIVALLVSAVIILVNVGFTSYLMFISSHDLALMLVLMVFALGIAMLFTQFVASAFQANMKTVVQGVTRIGEGDLTTRIAVASGDELQEIAETFNTMATQLQDAASARARVEEARRQLINAVSHDLRTPLATIRAMIESIDDGVVADAETVARYHRTMLGEIEYLSRLIDDLFELSQLDSGLLQLHVEAGSISDLVSDTLEVMRLQAEQRKLRLRGEVPESLPSVAMDARRIQRVLYNLVQNAFRHTPADGSVVISARQTGDEVQVAVEDTGEGFDPEELPLIFDRFYRGSRARSREEAGSGLGLTIARGIIELHGGRIWAESERERGARLTFTLQPAAIPGDAAPVRGEARVSSSMSRR